MDESKCEESPNGLHCDHSNEILASMPPIPVYICCWCGRRRTERIKNEFNKPHGTKANVLGGIYVMSRMNISTKTD
jgi:hypothetical protein